ncbi:MAG TPA: exodeoxyribonuclease V subunit gamma [Aeromicrobium sp.]|nr:exodeoxyribonuclease V subunit gamma [Aeromicrobium sp.]
MTFFIHRSDSVEVLADDLAEMLSQAPADPFETELVVIGAPGSERWLSQRLSHHLGAGPGRGDGVTAAIRFARPHSLVSELLGDDHTDPWRPDSLIWHVLAEVDRAFGEPWLSTLSAHLGHGQTGIEADLRRQRRLPVARRLAQLFHGYARQRPQLTSAWAAGLNEDGTGKELAADLHWQAELWRRLVRSIAAPSPDVRIAEALARLARNDLDLDLPARISLFGHSRVPAGELQVLAALGEHRDVHLWLNHPSPTAWDKLRGSSGIEVRADSTDAQLIENPLLGTLGRDVRELQRSIISATGEFFDEQVAGPTRPPTLLGRLQSDIIADRFGEGNEPPARTDQSIQIHSCHGRARQVEVIREVVVGLLADDPTLEPRDILVMVPDIESFAPLFSAAFGVSGFDSAEHHPAQQIRLMLADRSPTRTNRLLAFAVELLEVSVRGRFTNTEVLGLIGAEPVCEHFGFTDDDLDRISRWVESTEIRWGLDLANRQRFGVWTEQNTWRAGLDRLATGVVAAEHPDRPVAQVLPLDDVPSGDVDLVGRLLEFFDALNTAVGEFAEKKTASSWAEALNRALSSLADVSITDDWQRHQLDAELDELSDDRTELGLGEILALLHQRWAGRPNSASFRTGALTVCTMVPMRSVPHRVVCLVGLDDGSFPRATHAEGDDALARNPLTGERDPRAEDRQLLLDAIMSAGQALVITYTGADEYRGQASPPAVPVGELIDQVKRMTGGADIVIKHPLQPFDARNLTPGALLADGRSFSFDPAALAGAQADLQHISTAAKFLPTPLAPAEHSDLTLEELERFFQNPIKGFWQQRLGVTLASERDPASQTLPITLGPLDKWKIGDRVLGYGVEGVSAADAWSAISRIGLLGPGELGNEGRAEIVDRVATLIGGTQALRDGEPTTLDIDLLLPHGRRLTGTISEIYGDIALTVTYSSVRAKHRLRDWIRLLALTAQDPNRDWEVRTAAKIGRGTAQLISGPLADPTAALGYLTQLVELRDEGLNSPLPLPPELAYTFATGLRGSGPIKASATAEREWNRDRNDRSPDPERDGSEIVKIWGPNLAYSALRNEGFELLAPRLWDPALEHQREAVL